MSKKSKALIAVSLTLQLMSCVLRLGETWVNRDRHTESICCAELKICPATTHKGESMGTHNVYYVKRGAMSEMFISHVSR